MFESLQNMLCVKQFAKKNYTFSKDQWLLNSIQVNTDTVCFIYTNLDCYLNWSSDKLTTKYVQLEHPGHKPIFYILYQILTADLGKKTNSIMYALYMLYTESKYTY